MKSQESRLSRHAAARTALPLLGFLLAASNPLHGGTHNQTFTFANGVTNIGGGASVGGTPAGTASVQGNQLRLSSSATQNSSTSYRLPLLDSNLEVTAFTMDFDLTFFETAGGSPPGDGFSINFGAIPAATTDYGPGEEGWDLPNGLVISFDTFDNGGEAIGIEAKANGQSLRTITLDSLAPGGSYLNLFDNVARHVTIHWDVANGLDISYNGQAVMTDIPTPGFVPEVGNRFAFSARTGVSTQDVFLDNMAVSTTPAPPIETGGPVINEFVADNEDGRVDEDCEPGAWIEIYNGQNAAANLAGWHLTDDPAIPAKWTLPSISMTAYGHTLVWIDGKDRSTPPNYHASFALNPVGGYVALTRPDNTVSNSFDYGPQAEDIAYGKIGFQQIVGYLETPTPGVKNSGRRADGPPSTEEVQFTRPGGLITGAITLDVAPPIASGAVIRYSLTNDPPHALSPAWPAGGLMISTSANVRAQVFEPNRLPGPLSSRGFILLDPSLTNYRGSGQPFSSNLPVIVFHSFGNAIDNNAGSPGLRTFRYAYAVTLDRDPDNNNRVVITGPADFQGRSGVHVRGETSAGFPQRPYSWELWDSQDGDKDESILGLPADSDWALISNYNDKTVIRNKQPFDTLYDLDGEGSAMRERYVEVFFRQDSATGPVRWQDYRGVYVFTERIKRHDDRVNIDKLEPCDNVLTGNPAVDDQAVISGGYIFRKDKDPQVNQFTIGSYGTFQINEPDPPTTNQRNYLSGYMGRFNTALNGANFTDPVNGYARYIDVPSFIDIHLWVEIYKQIDGYRLSSYFYKDRAKKVVSAPLWDYNLCIGNGMDPGTGYPASFEKPQEWYFTSNSGASYPFYNRLFQDPEFTLKYWDRYWQLRRSLFSPQNIVALIDEAVTELSDNNPNANITNGSGAWPNNTPSMDVPIGRHNGRWQRLGVRDWPNPTNHQLRTRWTSPVDPATVTATTPNPFQSVSEIAFGKVWMLQRLLWMDDQSMTFNATNRNLKPPYFNQYGGQVNSGFQLDITNPNASQSLALYVTTNGTDPRVGAVTPTSTPLIVEDSNASYLVPSTTNGGDMLTLTAGANQWNNISDPPNIANWTPNAQMGYGFRATLATFDPYIKTNVQAAMQPAGGTANATLYVRVPFNVTQTALDSLIGLKLRMRYDDAYIAYLNGFEVARKVVNASFVPTWNSASGASHADNLAIAFEDVDISAFKGRLQLGNNALAIHGMNSISTHNDFLLQPRLEGVHCAAGGVCDDNASIVLTQTTNVKARFFDGASGIWSPLTESLFVVNTVPASASNIVISEMHYNPLDPTPAEVAAGVNAANDFEWIEITNISTSAVDLTNCRFTEGITFNWFDASAEVQTLGPGQRMIICENLAAFNLRYGSAGATTAGTFVGNLANGGEAIRLVDSAGSDIKFFVYDDDPPWPKDADGPQYDASVPPVLIGGGYSLVLVNPRANPDHNLAINWRSSADIHGSAGALDYTPFTGSPTGDTDGDGIPDLIEYATGPAPGGNEAGLPVVGIGEFNVNNAIDAYVTFTFSRNLDAGNVTMLPEISPDLRSWQNGSAVVTYVGSQNNGDGTETVIWRSSQPASLLPPFIFARLAVSQL